MQRYSSNTRRGTYALAIVLSVGITYAFPEAQSAPPQTPTKKALTVDDYTKWRSIGAQEISADGKWVAYVLQSANVPATETKPVLHILNLETNVDVAVQHETAPVFTFFSASFTSGVSALGDSLSRLTGAPMAWLPPE